MSRTYRHGDHGDGAGPFAGLKKQENFRCRHCKMVVGPPPSGGRHRNHCPSCLYSRHVDDRRPGDRASHCGASMAPVGVFTRRNGEYALMHRCLSCAIERHNRIAADDDFDRVLALPLVEAPNTRDKEARQAADRRASA